MNTNLFMALWLMLLTYCSSCEKQKIEYQHDDFQITINTGENWLHDFDLFLGLKKKNPPQFAIWLEDTKGNYLSSVYVTNKIANEGWIANKGNRRKEALPHWSYKRGVMEDDGLYLPTKDNPVTDGISGATPVSNKEILLRINPETDSVVIKAEFNHSTDFNEFFPENAKEGDPNYSGGKMGSGQPAIVYADTLILNQENIHHSLKIIGHSSPDGSDGNIHNDLSTLTTALTIVDSISVNIIK